MSKSVLNAIIENKKNDLLLVKQTKPLSEPEALSSRPDFLCNFIKGRLSIIAEVKKASPSKGIIRKKFDPIEIAVTYERSGASAISVLTEEKYFMGSLDYLINIKESVTLPLLRKDFIIDEYQILEAYYAGASAVLLIVSALSPDMLKKFIAKAADLNLTALVEVHHKDELKIALDQGASVIGINNRNLKTFKTDIKLTETLIPMVPKDKIIISESGINTLDDIRYLKELGVDAALIGEAFMREKEFADMVKEFSLF